MEGGGVSEFFLRAAEVWVADDDSDALRLESGLYGSLQGFATASASLRLRSGEGIAASARDQGAPIASSHLVELETVRGEALIEADLVAGVAFPLWCGRNTSPVVVLLAGGKSRTTGALEVWCRQRAASGLAWSGGYYASLDAFGEVSRRTSFACGEGLPGLVEAERQPRVITELSASARFVRSRGAAFAGLSIGVGFPLVVGDAFAGALVLLSSEDTPVAGAYEVWSPALDRRALEIRERFAPGRNAFAEAPRVLDMAGATALPARAAREERPIATDDLTAHGDAWTEAARQAGLRGGIALPVCDSTGVRSVLALVR